ncbi:MAG: zinc ribbon domain-containing protein [Candidatus Odinarchaeota archaeon]
MKLEENVKIFKERKINKLNFLIRLMKMIQEGCTGFALAYEVEKNRKIRNLIYDGILFYNTFIEIGKDKFIEAPDKKIENYKSFRTVEDTEKYIFMLWLNDTITSLQKELYPEDDYTEYFKSRKTKEVKETKKSLREDLNYCKNCGARIMSKEQRFCEKCGVDLSEM